MAALLLDLPAEPTAQDEHQIRITLGAIAAQVELEQIQAQFSQEEDRLKYDGSTASSSGLNSLSGDVRNGASQSGGASTDSTSLLSEVERTLEEWRINDEAWERSRFGSESSSESDDDDNSDPDRPKLSHKAESATIRPSNDPFDFLVSMFPNVSFASIGDKLASGQDLDAIMDELMTEDFIKHDELELTPKKAAPAVTKKQARKGPKDAFVVSLTDVLHRPPSPNLNHRKDAGSGSQASAFANAPSSGNHWAAVDSRSGHLASLTHVTTARVTSLLHVNGNSPARALAALLNQLRSERPRPKGPDDQVDQLRAIMPGLSTERYQLLLSATEDDISDAMDLQAFIGQTEVDGGAPLAKAELIADPQLGKSVVVQHQKRTGPGSALYDHVVRSPVAGTVALPTVLLGQAPKGHAYNPEAYSHAECTAFAQEYLAKVSIRIAQSSEHVPFLMTDSLLFLFRSATRSTAQPRPSSSAATTRTRRASPSTTPRPGASTTRASGRGKPAPPAPSSASAASTTRARSTSTTSPSTTPCRRCATRATRGGTRARAGRQRCRCGS